MSFGASDSLVDLFTGNLGAVLLVAWDKACAVAYAARSDPKDFAVPPPASGGELTAAAVRDAQAAAPWMPTTIAGLLASIVALQAPPGATPRKPRRRSSTGARRRSFDALSPDAKFVSKRFDAARRGNAVSELNPRVLGRLVAEGGLLNDAAVAALATRAPFVDSGALGVGRRGKKVMGTSRVVGRQMDNELAALRADLRANREGRENAPPAPATPAIAKAKARYAAAARRAPATPVQPRGFSEPELHALKTIFAMFDQDGGERLSRADLLAYADAIGEFALPQDVDAVFTCLAGNATTIGLEEWVLFAAKLKTAWDYNSTPATPVSPVASRTRSAARGRARAAAY